MDHLEIKLKNKTKTKPKLIKNNSITRKCSILTILSFKHLPYLPRVAPS